MGAFLDILYDVKCTVQDLVKKLVKNPNFKRWVIELSVAIVVGILAGSITFNVMSKGDKSLKINDKSETAIEDEQVASTGEASVAEEAGETEEDYSNVVITVTDPTTYASNVSDWSSEEIDAAISERKGYLENNKYWPAVSSYWQSARGISDNSCYCSYLFDTAGKVYSAEDFNGVPAEVIHVAKNEIYARHGYSFKDTEIYNYFMGQIWYTPSVMPADFSEETFTETEVKNLDLLNSIDTM